MQRQHFFYFSQQYVEPLSYADSARHIFARISPFPGSPSLLYLCSTGTENGSLFSVLKTATTSLRPRQSQSSIPLICFPHQSLQSISLTPVPQTKLLQTTLRGKTENHSIAVLLLLFFLLFIFPLLFILFLCILLTPLPPLLFFRADAFQGKGRKGGTRGRSICLTLLYLPSVLPPSPSTITFLASP